MREGMAAVIGATGFLGSRLVSELGAAGRPLALFNRSAPAVVGGRASAGLRDAQTVFFLAAGLNPVLAASSPEAVAAEHALLTEVLEALVHARRRPVFVLASSGGAVYAPAAHSPYRESALTGPTSAYGLAKLRLEQRLLGYSRRIRPLALRLSNVYGPGQRLARGYGVLPHWLAAAARDEPVRIFGDPRVARDYVHVDDVARMLAVIHDTVGAGLADTLPEVLNVGSGIPTPLGDLLDIVREVVGRNLVVRPEEGRPFDRQSNWLDTSLARDVLGWKAEVELRDGVRQCWAHLQELRTGAGPLM
ncbi:NAD-dependent epimerase/dehydratase family protein [Kitasatospora sp. NPDC048239]|uniref:NAD-dependent epimerase/dehydratase family protein n=1 Tax=Kitasatospora sp. NPDC048239 TaxID=3364046 RepID=UPI003715B871